ncbi:hypothetical protein D6C83_03606, partial [Aureobasidium pullulans]
PVAVPRQFVKQTISCVEIRVGIPWSIIVTPRGFYGISGEQFKQSHATGPSKVPQVIQEAAPKKLEQILPEKIHPTK